MKNNFKKSVSSSWWARHMQDISAGQSHLTGSLVCSNCRSSSANSGSIESHVCCSVCHSFASRMLHWKAVWTTSQMQIKLLQQHIRNIRNINMTCLEASMGMSVWQDSLEMNCKGQIMTVQHRLLEMTCVKLLRWYMNTSCMFSHAGLSQCCQSAGCQHYPALDFTRSCVVYNIDPHGWVHAMQSIACRLFQSLVWKHGTTTWACNRGISAGINMQLHSTNWERSRQWDRR